MYVSYVLYTRNIPTLAGVSQLVGHCPANQKLMGLIPNQGTAWVAGSVPSWDICMRQTINVCLLH